MKNWLKFLRHQEDIFFQPVVLYVFISLFQTSINICFIFNYFCLTQIRAIIEGAIGEEEQWKVFSDEISAQFIHDMSSISLSEVDLVNTIP